MLPPAIAAYFTERRERAGAQGFGRVGHHQTLAHQHLRPEAVAVRAHALGVVEGEHLRRGLLIGDAAGRAVKAIAEQEVSGPFARHDKGPLPEPQRVVNGLFQAAVFPLAEDQAIDHDFDVVAAVAVELGGFVEGENLAINAHADVAGFLQVREQLVVLAFALLDYWGEDVQARVCRQGADAGGDLSAALGADRLAALGAVRGANAGEQDAQIVVDFRDGANGGAGALTGGFLRDGDGRGQAGDLIDIGLFHRPQKLARVRRQRGDVAALPFGVQGVEGQRGLARAGDAGEADQFVFG